MSLPPGVGDAMMSQDLSGNSAIANSQGLYVEGVADAMPTGGDHAIMSGTNGDVALSYLQTLCPEGDVQVDPETGRVTMDPAFASQSMDTPHGGTCGALSDMVNSENMWDIQIDDSEWPHTDFDNSEAGMGDHGSHGTGGVVTAPSPNGDKLWGAATEDGGTDTEIPPWLVLGHELLGHAWLGDRAEHPHMDDPYRGEGGHAHTVDQENMIRAEHGFPLRGGHLDHHCGESFYRNKSDPDEVHWSYFHGVCEDWRDDRGHTLEDDLN